MTKVVIEVRGGVVQDVYTDTEEIEYTVIDYDNIEAGEAAKQEFETMAIDGRRIEQVVSGELPTEMGDDPDYEAGKFVCRICGGEMQMTEDTQEYYSADPATGEFPPSDPSTADVTDRRIYCKNDHTGRETGWDCEYDENGLGCLVKADA